MLVEREIVCMEVKMTVYGEMSTEEPEVRYDSDMAGHPGCSAEFEIHKIEVGGFDITQIINQDIFNEIAEIIIKLEEDND